MPTVLCGAIKLDSAFGELVARGEFAGIEPRSPCSVLGLDPMACFGRIIA
jgi:hypothetical protein